MAVLEPKSATCQNYRILQGNNVFYQFEEDSFGGPD